MMSFLIFKKQKQKTANKKTSSNIKLQLDIMHLMDLEVVLKLKD